MPSVTTVRHRLITDAQENVMQRGSEAHSRSVAVASMAYVHKGNTATEGLICMTCSNTVFAALFLAFASELCADSREMRLILALHE